ncbi:MAG: hypothetical protein F4056_07650 [Chloroflexi bacterium]|nr:hypothetical protein [Chloroflexota bacterium]
MTTEAQPDMTWSALSDAEPSARISEMRQRFDALSRLDQPSREQQAESMIRAEYALDDESLADFTESRLRSWLSLAADNIEGARDVARAYDRAFERVPGEMAMHRAGLVHMIARDRLTPEDTDVLYELIPRLVENVPRASQEAVEHAAEVSRLTGGGPAASGGKPWWKFW